MLATTAVRYCGLPRSWTLRNGSRSFPWRSVNAIAAAMPTASSVTVVAACAWKEISPPSPRETPPTAKALRTKLRTSKLLGRLSRMFPMAASARIKLARAKANTNQNTARHPKASVTKPPNAGAMTGAAPWVNPNQPMRRPRCPSGNSERMETWVRFDTSAFAQAWTIRAAMRGKKLGARALAATEAANNPTARQ